MSLTGLRGKGKCKAPAQDEPTDDEDDEADKSSENEKEIPEKDFKQLAGVS